MPLDQVLNDDFSWITNSLLRANASKHFERQIYLQPLSRRGSLPATVQRHMGLLSLHPLSGNGFRRTHPLGRQSQQDTVHVQDTHASQKHVHFSTPIQRSASKVLGFLIACWHVFWDMEALKEIGRAHV